MRSQLRKCTIYSVSWSYNPASPLDPTFLTLAGCGLSSMDLGLGGRRGNWNKRKANLKALNQQDRKSNKLVNFVDCGELANPNLRIFSLPKWKNLLVITVVILHGKQKILLLLNPEKFLEGPDYDLFSQQFKKIANFWYIEKWFRDFFSIVLSFNHSDNVRGMFKSIWNTSKQCRG